MTILAPGDSTSALTNQMTMKPISNAEYAAIDDINITITGYAMGTEDMSLSILWIHGMNVKQLGIFNS